MSDQLGNELTLGTGKIAENAYMIEKKFFFLIQKISEEVTLFAFDGLSNSLSVLEINKSSSPVTGIESFALAVDSS